MSGHTPGPWMVDPKYPLAVRPTADSTDDRRPGKLMVDNAEVANLAGGDHIPNYGPGTRGVAYAKAYRGDAAIVHPEITYEHAKANARLIAAAPDLLEACRTVLRAYYDADVTEDALERAHDAVRKAEGGAS